MNKEEAINIIEKELTTFRSMSYSELKNMVGVDPVVKDITAKSDSKYHVEITVHWDDEPNGNIRVLGAIDGMGWRSIVPLNSDFIMSPEGKFIDE